MVETWRIVNEFPAYLVSDLGRVQRSKTGRILKPWLTKKGRPYVDLCMGNHRKKRFPHNLVMEAFVGPKPEGMEVNHKDGDKVNNRLDNLEYVTPSENSLHAIRTGLRKAPKGSRCNKAKLNEEQVYQIKLLLKQGIKCPTIARQFNVTAPTIYKIADGRTWTQVIVE